MKRILAFFLLPLWGFALEVQPWFGDVFEFHFLGSYIYSRFLSVQNAVPQLKEPFNSHLAYLGLDFSPTPEWSVDTDMQFAATTQEPFNFRSFALQGRYLWYDDIIGDPISFVTGVNARVTSSTSLKDVSCPSHGNVDFELDFSLGKEFDASDCWRFRVWGYGAVGHANRGSPWVKGIVAFETNYDDEHKFAVYADGSCGYGGHKRIDIDHFYGYAKIRQRSIDAGFRYGYRMGVWGTLRLGYEHRFLAKSCPAKVNAFVFSYLLPFSF